MSRTPSTTIRISERLTPLRGIAAIDADGIQIPGSATERRVSRWSRLLTVTDPVIRDAGIRGERMLAKYRLFGALVLLILPIRAVMEGPRMRENYIGLAISLGGVFAGVFFTWLANREVVRLWIGFASSLIDVSWVSAGLAAFILIGMPQISVNSRVVFEVYFICIAATSFRYDQRVCLVTGLAAMLQYSLIVLWAGTTLETPTGWNNGSYGEYVMVDQIGRVAILGLATAVSFAIVLRVQQLRVLSVRDRLTGLMIRGYFDERISEAFDRAKKTGDALAVAMIDLDYFKSFNDRFGHAVGDLVLASVSRAIKDLVRAEDVVGRYGGEELIVMLPGLDRARATARMERIRRAISQVRVELDAVGGTITSPIQPDLFVELPSESRRPVLTASIGVASWPEDRADSVEALVYRADSRLLTAKSTGRNRVVSMAGTTDEFAVLTGT